MARATRETFGSECWYCQAPVKDRYEADHVPVPHFKHTRPRGTRTQDACHVCHDLKDRIPLNEWRLALWAEAMEGLLPQHFRLLARLLMHAHEVAATADGTFVELEPAFCQGLADEADEVLQTLHYPANLLLAKIASISYHVQEVRGRKEPNAHVCEAR